MRNHFTPTDDEGPKVNNSLPQYEVISQSRPVDFASAWYELIHPEHFWLNWRMRAFLRQFQDLGLDFDSTGNALEVGCGTGLLTQQLEQHLPWTIDGADLNEEALNRHKTGRGRLLCYDVTARDSRFHEKYDALILFDVIEHVEDASKFLADCLFHLRPGGLIFVNVPALQSAYSDYDRVLGHHQRYQKRDLKALFAACNTELIDVRYWGFSLLPILYLRKLVLAIKLLFSSSSSTTVRIGMAPPSIRINQFLDFVGNIECGLLSSSPIGSSLLAVARKRE